MVVAEKNGGSLGIEQLEKNERIKALKIEGDYPDEILKDCVRSETRGAFMGAVFAIAFFVVGLIFIILNVALNISFSFKLTGIASAKFVDIPVGIFFLILSLLVFLKFGKPEIQLKQSNRNGGRGGQSLNN